MAVLAVAGDVFDDALDKIWDLIESVSEGFPTYFCRIRRAFES